MNRRMCKQNVANCCIVNNKMAECDTAFNLVKKPHTTSSVWAHFGLKGDEKGLPIPDEIEKPVCRHCKKVVLAKRSNTSNLFSYLEDHGSPSQTPILEFHCAFHCK